MRKFSTNNESLSILQKITILLSLILLIISFTQPAFYINRPENSGAWSDSFFLFFLGWMSLFGGNLLATIIWLANPLYVLSIILTLKGKQIGFYLSLLSTIVALSFTQVQSIMTSESGKYSKIVSLELGYKFWLISFTIMTLGTGINWYLIKSKNANH